MDRTTSGYRIDLENPVKTAFNKGYRVIHNGDVIGPRGRPRKLSVNMCGYKTFNIEYYGKTKPIMVHRLYAYQAYGDIIFNEGIQVRHLNGNRSDNSPENIAIGTASQNMMDVPEETRFRTAKAGADSLKKLTKEQVREIRIKNFNGVSYNKLVKEYGVCKTTISYLINRITYADVI